MSYDVSANISNSDKLYAQYKLPKKTEEQQQRQVANQEASHATALQWTATKVNGKTDLNVDSSLGEEDVAFLSSNVATHSESVKIARNGNPVVGKMLDAFRSAYRNSKSHNMLLERFFSTVQVSALKTGLSLMGIEPAEIARIQSEVREEALQEIDTKLGNDWASAVVLNEVVA